MADTTLDHNTQAEHVTGQRSRTFARRLVFAGLVGGTWLAAVAVMMTLLAANGLTISEGAIALFFGLSILMVVVGFWNSAIGAFVMLKARDYLDVVAPFHRNLVDRSRSHVAIAMPIYNEDAETVFGNLHKLLYSLDSADVGDNYDVFVLSDSTDPQVRAEEVRRFRAWRQSDPRPGRLHYRHREDNVGFKAGNMWDFVQQHGDNFDYMLVLDADSKMEGRTVDRMVRMMDANPRLGILQSLAVGRPADGAFARLFQYGMRHGMLVNTVGAAWWQGEAGPFWGHNAVVRLDAFKNHCELEKLPGKPPLGGHILSHDQVEAALMHAAGYEVRVLPVEGGSYEEMPPTLPDFIKRDLRWCQGNMQYLKLIGSRRFSAMGRANLVTAILMYVGAPAWLAFMVTGLAQAMMGDVGANVPEGDVLWGTPGPEVAIALFVTMMGITFAPKVIGYTHALIDTRRRTSYGGGLKVLGGALAELGVSVLVAPIVMLAQSIFVVGLALGHKVQWEAQARDGYRLSWREGFKSMWPQTLLGLGATALLAWQVPSVLPWAAPVLIGLLLAVPLTVFTAHPRVGRALADYGVCAIPEERATGGRLTVQPPASTGYGGVQPLPLEAPRARVDQAGT